MEPKEVMTVISNENRRTPHLVIINTYAVIDGKFSACFVYRIIVFFCFFGRVCVSIIVASVKMVYF